MEWIKNWFSNMLPFDEPLVYEGIKYRTVENFYQAMKFYHLDDRQFVANLNPYAAKKFAKGKAPDFWKDVKLGIMLRALRHKFAQGTSWHKKLMATGDEPIIEWNNWNDLYWGVDVQSSRGYNHLGKLLMKIREEHRDLESRKKKRNEDLIKLFLNGAPVSALQEAYTLHEKVVCEIIRSHLVRVESELADEKKTNKALGKGMKGQARHLSRND